MTFLPISKNVIPNPDGLYRDEESIFCHCERTCGERSRTSVAVFHTFSPISPSALQRKFSCF
jgi:hypothetical protein